MIIWKNGDQKGKKKNERKMKTVWSSRLLNDRKARMYNLYVEFLLLFDLKAVILTKKLKPMHFSSCNKPNRFDNSSTTNCQSDSAL